MKRLLIFFISFCWSLTVVAQSLPREALVPGGVAVVKLGKADTPAPRTFLGDDRVMVLRHDDAWVAIVGIPLTLAPGTHSLKVEGEENRRFEFKIAPKEYSAQHITLKNKRMVDPTPSDLERITREQTVIRDAFGQWREQDLADINFDLPAKGRLSGFFGTRRFFNEQERQPHNGIDLAAPKGSAIVAPADGKVVATGEYFFNGRTVFLDHGQGLVTMYNHLERIAVKPGDIVKRGTRIGDVGMSGRATGPHLHWAVSLNNTRVDPLLFLSESARKQLEQHRK